MFGVRPEELEDRGLPTRRFASRLRLRVRSEGPNMS